MDKPFSVLKSGEKFLLNNIKYSKIDLVKISCCKSVNCQQVDSNNRIFVQPNTIVKKVNE